MQDFDVVVVGAGPGGYVAAIRAAQLGMKTAIVEKEHMGGVCLNWGCIPTKALLRTAEVKHLIDHAEEFGLKVAKPEIMLDKVVERSRKIAGQLAAGIKHLMKKNKITVLEGHGSLKGKSILSVKDNTGKTEDIKAKHIILATGARARTLPHLEVDGDIVWTARHAMTPKTMPKSLVIVGSGAIGIEFASFYRTLGVEVTVIEMIDRILPQEDPEISALALKNFEKQGIKFVLSATVEKLEKTQNSAKVFVKTAKGQEIFEASNVILAIGIIGNTENLGLENTKAKVEKNQIQTNEWCQTAESGLYAIGDVAGAPWLAHKASHEAIICVEKIAGLPGVHPLNKLNIPGCTYSLPQVASIGLTEEKAKAEGRAIKVGRFPYIGNGKAIALGDSEGLVKTIFDAKTGELLGAHMIGAEVTELIQGFGIAKTLETTEADLMHTIFPHPTLSEMMHESVLNAFGRTIHI
ncbi:dihydrolipoyl dehydrogenase [Candidatus Odyssella acanthamoebae]|uniref:Dihydrolipoyl dehydrogenase n=1 Tax=Candidatus Odyssella acanthamoebae TaxID=91604 RepID=A0A077AVG2_9PROT|nr:dihydrolipoyl dehydrogenase [Candidatus Paracaedibacter acanthamoebae]AIK96024.1 dihydrolipoamide dehydrogenase [Candidatus Paracaedibacter acanthamoebae]